MYICQICKKVPATIHLTDIHNNVKKEVHICESCAKEKGFNLHSASNLPQLLGLAAKKKGTATFSPPGKTEDDPVCPKCGLKWSEFNERGRLGCPEDYQAFTEKLHPIIANQIVPHGKSTEILHIGKKPGAGNRKNDQVQAILDLERKLRRAVAEERYEEAARLKSELDAVKAHTGDPEAAQK